MAESGPLSTEHDKHKSNNVVQLYRKASDTVERISEISLIAELFKREATWWLDNNNSDVEYLSLCRNLLHGFSSIEDEIYNLNSENRHRYLSYLARKRTERIDGYWEEMTRNKLTFHLLMNHSGYQDRVPDLYGLYRNDSLFQFDSTTDADRSVTSELSETLHNTRRISDPMAQIRSYLESDKLVFKPVHGATGKGIYTCDKRGGTYHINGQSLSEAQFSRFLRDLDDYLITEFVHQSDYADGLFENATNTLRVMTVYDNQQDERFIPIAVQRIGTSRSAPVDNWSRGGLSAEIDITTGTLSSGIQYPYDQTVVAHENHPETGNTIRGTRVPHWEQITEELRNISLNLGISPYLGWDIVITDDTDGDFMILEANCSPDVDLLQVHRPLLEDSRMVSFYSEHGII